MLRLLPRPSLLASVVVAGSLVSGLAFGTLSAGAFLLLREGRRR